MMSVLDRECEVFCRYLIGQEPTEYVRAKYREFHKLPEGAAELQGLPLDPALLALARLHPVAARFGDTYARIACPTSVLRKKLVLTLAILECCAPSHRHIAAVEPAAAGRRCARLFLAAGLFAGTLATALVVLAPCHLLAAAAARARRWSQRRPQTP
jgi:hypothetical protein